MQCRTSNHLYDARSGLQRPRTLPLPVPAGARQAIRRIFISFGSSEFPSLSKKLKLTTVIKVVLTGHFEEQELVVKPVCEPYLPAGQGLQLVAAVSPVVSP